jgi:hypothetical protein
VDVAVSAEAVRAPRHRADNLHHVAGFDRDRLRTRPNQALTPASIPADNWLPPEWAPDAPVATGQHLDQPSTQRMQDGVGELLWWVVPIDLADDELVAEIDVHASGAA